MKALRTIRTMLAVAAIVAACASPTGGGNSLHRAPGWLDTGTPPATIAVTTAAART